MNILEKAREWAEEIQTENVRGLTTGGVAAAEVVRGLPDSWVDTEELWQLIQAMEDELAGNHWPGDIGYGRVISTANWMEKLKGLLQQSAPRVEVRMGVWAMHPEHGKVMIVSTKPDPYGEVRAAHEHERAVSGTTVSWVAYADLSPLPEDVLAAADFAEKENLNG